MIYNFSDRKKQNDLLEDELKELKKDHQKIQMSEEQFRKLKRKMEETDMKNNQKPNKARMKKYTAAAAAIIAGFMILPNTSAAAAHAMGQIPIIGQLAEAVTLRDYQYESDRNSADIKVPEIKVAADSKTDDQTQENLEHTAAEMNAEIQKITDKLIKEFETNLEEEGSYQDVIINSEVLHTTPDYFTLKLNCYQGAGSGYEWNYYYTIDLKTGERLQLKNLFQKGADYKTLISENIKEQMKEQMEADENVMYWLDNEIEEWNFKSITDETSFYLNGKDQVVIAFNEGDVAPYYMGTVEFEIPAEVLSGIRK